MTAVRTGISSTSSAAAPFSLADRYEREDGLIYLTGLQALVRLVLDRARIERAAGRSTASFVSGYEGSPLAGYDLELIRRKALLAALDVVHQPGLNEELAATAVSGSQLAGSLAKLRPSGVVGYWYGKAPGLDRATDAFRHANLIGTSPVGGAVAFVGDDPGAKSSSVPSSSEPALADLDMITFDPADPGEVLAFGRHAVEVSRASGLWSALKIATAVADGAATAHAVSAWTPPDLTDLSNAYAHTPSAKLLGADLARLERSQQLLRLPVAVEYVKRSGVNQVFGGGSARLGIVAAGKTFVDVQHALRLLGVTVDDLERYGVRLLKLGAVYPIEPTIVREFATGLDRIVVVEDKRSYLEDALRTVLYGTPNPPAIVGQRDLEGMSLFPPVGELDPDAVATGLARVGELDGVTLPALHAWREPRPRERPVLALANRMPYFCSGCPHNSSTKVAPGTLVGGGIGCHAMVMFMPEQQVGRVTGLSQMGGEGVQWLGMAPFVDEQHFVQNIGDGTFVHSGSLAIRAAVAAGVNVTYKLLRNSAVAMTGGQDAVGELPLDRLIELLSSEGVARVVVTSDDPKVTRRTVGRRVDVRHRDDLLAVQEELALVPGVTVLIHDQECAAEKRRKRKRGTRETPPQRVVINQRVCEGCGDCGSKSNCLSVQPVPTEFGRKTEINQSSCNLDFSCLEGDCPSFLTVIPGKNGRSRPDLATVDLPTPVATFDAARFTMRITGVGGTGVVTVSQVIATAAVLDGCHVRALDQTGLAQKGGAVVSDLTITATDEPAASKLTRTACDLYLGCDSLVATDPKHLEVADVERTVAVVSTTQVPTGVMVVEPAVSFPGDDKVISRIRASSAQAHFLDARTASTDALGDEQFANIVLFGAAFQAGAVPLTVGSIEAAIRMNGAAVEKNLAAFAHGRRLVAPPVGAMAQIASGSLGSGGTSARPAHPVATVVGAEAGSELRRLVDLRVGELVDYQDERYAQRYAGVVERVRAREAVVTGTTTLAEAVAVGLHKLMAYKDEYEVARLSLEPEFRQNIADEFGADARYSYRLHPPVLRALGMNRKIALGQWFDPAFATLRSLRRVRGTRLDPFGYAHVRRVERGLVTEYQAVVEGLLGELSGPNHQAAVALAALPDMVRGYEDIKLASVERYHARLAELLAEFAAAGLVTGIPA